MDNRGPHPDFSLTLREITLWSERRPGHVPIVILLELKSDYMFLDPGLVEWDAGALSRLDDTVRAAIPSGRLLTPDEMRGGAASMAAVRGDAAPGAGEPGAGWPPLGELRDRILVVLHTSGTIDELYVAGDPRLTGRAMFTSASGESLLAGAERPDALFAIHNDPDPEAIAQLTESGLIVRTRADADLEASVHQRSEALGSTAQIVSTDLPPGHPNDPALGTVEFAAGATLTQRR